MQKDEINEFVENLHYGDEMDFVYRGQEYHIEGYTGVEDKPNNPEHPYHLCVFPIAEGCGYTWEGDGKDGYPVEEFLNAKLWDGRTFLEAAPEMEWVD